MTFARGFGAFLAGLAGFIVLLDAVGNLPLLADVALLLVDWAAILTALALLVGLLSVAGFHLRRVALQSADWPYSLILLAGLGGVIFIGIVGIPGVTVLFPQSLAEEPIRRIFTIVYEPLASSLLALLAFFSLSAALRALRRRQPEALVIIGVALLVLITQIAPLATLPFVGPTMQWLNDFVALSGARGLLIGVALGTLVASMRVLLGFDQPYLDR